MLILLGPSVAAPLIPISCSWERLIHVSVHHDSVALQETAKDDDVYEMPVGELYKGFRRFLCPPWTKT